MIYPISFLSETVDMQLMYAMLVQLSLVKSAIVIVIATCMTKGWDRMSVHHLSSACP